MALLDLGHVGAEPAGREDIGCQDRLIVGDGIGHLHERGVGEGNARLLGLETVPRSRRAGPAEKGGAGTFAMGVGVVTLSEVAGPAVGARTACDGGADHHPVAGREVADVIAHLLHDADRLVAEDGTGLHPRERATDEVQVGPTDRRGGDADDGIGGCLNPRLRHVIKADVAKSVKHDGLHARISRDDKRATRERGPRFTATPNNFY